MPLFLIYRLCWHFFVASPSNYIYYSTSTFYYFHLCSTSLELDLFVGGFSYIFLDNWLLAVSYSS